MQLRFHAFLFLKSNKYDKLNIYVIHILNDQRIERVNSVIMYQFKIPFQVYPEKEYIVHLNNQAGCNDNGTESIKTVY